MKLQSNYCRILCYFKGCAEKRFHADTISSFLAQAYVRKCTEISKPLAKSVCNDYFPNFLFTYKSIRNDMSVQFFICHIDSHLDTVQDLNSGNIHRDQVLLLPSRLTKQLEELALFLGRVSCLSSSFTRTSSVSVGTSLRLTAGSHLFHLHLELNWAAIETLCLLLEKQGKNMIY